MAFKNIAPSATAELSLVHLKSCLVNLPPSLVSVLDSVNAPIHNVIVEVLPRQSPSSGRAGTNTVQQPFYLGWTGMPSKPKAANLTAANGLRGARGSLRDSGSSTIELDATLARLWNLSEAQKVTVSIHLNPPVAHTIHIEPLTPEDWEMVELHATFLELNLQSQVRALPNPEFLQNDKARVAPYPLTLHLSPTSTANIKVVSLDPPPSTVDRFVKLPPNAEVIVAPKVRSKSMQSNGDHRSIASTSKSRRSVASTVRRRNTRDNSHATLFLRAVDRGYCAQFFTDRSDCASLTVWIDRDLLFAVSLSDKKFVSVDVLRPAGLQSALPDDGPAPTSTSASNKLIVNLRIWDNSPCGRLAALSQPLCAALGCSGIVGGIVKIREAPQPLPRGLVHQLQFFPFVSAHRTTEGLKFGGESKAEKEDLARRVRHIYSKSASTDGLLQGPMTDGIILGKYDGLEAPRDWAGGIVKFIYSSDRVAQDQNKESVSWIPSLDPKISIEVQQPQSPPPWLSNSDLLEYQPSHERLLFGIDATLATLQKRLLHMSSVLLTGTMGSGKSVAAQYLAQTLRQQYFFHTVYLPCRKLVNDETRVSTIKETLQRAFMSADWGARLGGKALVILDDLDRLCPAETELQVGNDNGRSRQVSEILKSIIKQQCARRDAGIVLLATAEGKDSMNKVVISSHLVREIIDLKAPSKDIRRKVLDFFVEIGTTAAEESTSLSSNEVQSITYSGKTRTDGEGATTRAWADTYAVCSSRASGFVRDSKLDLLEVAGSTDGYMPGDLSVLVSRARNEAIIRSFELSASTSETDAVILRQEDFDHALKGFTPASLRNVPLQSSSTTFRSIGGLRETRKVLLETLEYPTKYAPLFTQCPLRLRSGLLLYGYPGCGKTLLASAVAGECGLNFISVKGPEILNKYIGASEKSVRDLFDRAQAARPCVLFFDEFDSIAPKRGHGSTGVTDRIVNQLLTQMDGAEGLSGVYVLAATSRPDLIDPALLRPGRLDKSLLCDMPSLDDRFDILKSLLRRVKLSDDLTETEDTFLEVAHRTRGFSGADLQALVSNAQLQAIHEMLDRKLTEAKPGRGAGHSSSFLKGVSNFIQFPYGADTAAEVEAKTLSRSAVLAEDRAILAKLEQIKLSRKQSRDLLRDPNRENKAQNKREEEVVIGSSHIMAALESTRASISAEERARLERIYGEFVVGRSGQLKDGQGSMEIGGRSSLM